MVVRFVFFTYFPYPIDKSVCLLYNISKDGNGNIISRSDGPDFFYDHAGVACMTYRGTTHLWYRRDAQGNVIALVENGNVVARYVYDAWGNHKVLDANYNEITDTSHIGHINPIRYRGYYYDSETGLYYCNARYYDPTTGRFISADDISYLDPETINGLNLFSYCGNNPVMNVDPSGHAFFVTLLISTLICAAIGTVIEVGKQIYDGGNWNWDPTTWNYWEIGKGALIGAASGLAYGLGGIAGGIVRGSVKALTFAGKTLTVTQSVSVLLGAAASTSFIAGFGGYALHTAGTPEDDFNFIKGLSEGIGQSLKGLLSFCTGGMFGASGVWQFGQKNSFGTQIFNAMFRGIARFAANYVPNYVIDGIFREANL